MGRISPEQVINGSWGEAWVDNEYIAEVKGLTAEIAIEYEDIDRPRILSKGKKMIGYEGTGTLKMHKVTSKFVKKLTEKLKAGKQLYVTIISKVDDPDSIGAERIVLKQVVFENLNLANWEAKTAGEDEIPFAFEEWDLLDLIEA